MNIKVCGIKDQVNYNDLSTVNVEMIGFNHYPKSARYINNSLIKPQHNNTKHVGVFVNESLDNIKLFIDEFELEYVQLHGGESLDFCKSISSRIKIIKVFNVDDSFDFDEILAFEDQVEFYLFDTKSRYYGGSGKKFKWEVLEKYNSSKQFILSGGISIDDVEELKSIAFPQMWGVDINSKFEISPGLKDIELIQTFKNRLDESN